ncbi:MAG: serine acetyltransferase [Lachnospiraceae bacterium]|nr:serine acetyltransferase [Lachnospiraceae bacterium]
MEPLQTFQDNLVNLVTDIAESYRMDDPSISYFKTDLPNRDMIIQIIHQLRQLVFPGFFTPQKLSDSSLEFYVGDILMSVEEKLKKQILLALQYRSDICPETAKRQAESICVEFFRTIPRLREYISTDVEAAYDGDPASADKVEVIFSYPGTYATTIYRFAHELHRLDVPLIPRIMTEYAHNLTGIDIHPGATIGKYFFIDHGTGVVIGETTEIAEHVKLYQGVTLGALSTKGGQNLRGKKRHPTLEDNVVIYSGSTILGGETVIGRNSVISGNAFITSSVPADTKVSVRNPELKFKSGAKKEMTESADF